MTYNIVKGYKIKILILNIMLSEATAVWVLCLRRDQFIFIPDTLYNIIHTRGIIV